MAIEKGIVVEESKPQSVNGEAIEIEIVNPESVGIQTEDGGNKWFRIWFWRKLSRINR